VIGKSKGEEFAIAMVAHAETILARH
jgi:hypothetical protein